MSASTFTPVLTEAVAELLKCIAERDTYTATSLAAKRWSMSLVKHAAVVMEAAAYAASEARDTAERSKRRKRG